MTSKLKVDELRAKLSLRGLDTTGTKPILVKRLEAALHSEEEKEKEADPDEAAPASGVSNGQGKRKRSSDVDADDGEEAVCLEKETLVKYTVRELKDLAARCGVSASGTKMELVKRISGVAEIPKETVQEEVAEEIEEERLVTATKKGGAVLDQWLPDDIKTSFHVLHNFSGNSEVVLCRCGLRTALLISHQPHSYGRRFTGAHDGQTLQTCVSSSDGQTFQTIPLPIATGAQHYPSRTTLHKIRRLQHYPKQRTLLQTCIFFIVK